MMNFYNKYFLPRFLDFVMKRGNLEKYRSEIAGSASGIVLEIGFGSGLNLPHYKNIDKFYALEPSEELYDFAKEEINKALFPIEHLLASAENIPLSSNSVDYVVSTWSLCSISDITKALSEIERILKPSGKFVFIEHGKSPKDSAQKIQQFLTPFWKVFVGGCHLGRPVDSLMANTGFTFEKLEKFQQSKNPLMYMYKGIYSKK